MSELFWDAGDVPGDALRAWANKNVLDAIKYFWEEDPPVCWIDAKDDKLVLTVSGPRCQNESYSLDLDVFELLTEYGNPYADLKGGPCSDGQCEDMRERADVLRKLAVDLTTLAVRIDGAAMVGDKKKLKGGDK